VIEAQPTCKNEDPSVSDDLKCVVAKFGLGSSMCHASNPMHCALCVPHARANLNWKSRPYAPPLLCALRHLPSASCLWFWADFSKFVLLVHKHDFALPNFVFEMQMNLSIEEMTYIQGAFNFLVYKTHFTMFGKWLYFFNFIFLAFSLYLSLWWIEWPVYYFLCGELELPRLGKVTRVAGEVIYIWGK